MVVKKTVTCVHKVLAVTVLTAVVVASFTTTDLVVAYTPANSADVGVGAGAAGFILGRISSSSSRHHCIPAWSLSRGDRVVGEGSVGRRFTTKMTVLKMTTGTNLQEDASTSLQVQDEDDELSEGGGVEYDDQDRKFMRMAIDLAASE